MDTNTSFAVLRKSTISSLIRTRDRLNEFLNETKSKSELKDISGKNIIVSERENQVKIGLGLGKCAVSVEDIARAVVAYTATIKRYALHVSHAIILIINSFDLYCSYLFIFKFCYFYTNVLLSVYVYVRVYCAH